MRFWRLWFAFTLLSVLIGCDSAAPSPTPLRSTATPRPIPSIPSPVINIDGIRITYNTPEATIVAAVPTTTRPDPTPESENTATPTLTVTVETVIPTQILATETSTPRPIPSSTLLPTNTPPTVWPTKTNTPLPINTPPTVWPTKTNTPRPTNTVRPTNTPPTVWPTKTTTPLPTNTPPTVWPTKTNTPRPTNTPPTVWPTKTNTPRPRPTPTRPRPNPTVPPTVRPQPTPVPQIDVPPTAIAATPIPGGLRSYFTLWETMTNEDTGYCPRVDGRGWTGQFVWPLNPGDVDADRHFGGNHTGMDINGAIGTPVKAADNGIITWAGNSSSGGAIVIVIAHGNRLETIYAHLSDVAVSCGQFVTKGSVIGFSGQSGQAGWPHVHMEVRQGNMAYDPRLWLP